MLTHIKCIGAFSALCIAIFSGQSSSAATLLNTGTPTGNTNWSLYSGQGLAAGFTIGQDTTITSMSGFINTDAAGDLNFAIYSDLAGLPGSEVFSTTASLSTITGPNGQWEVVSGLNWNLTAGSYWGAFIPSNTYGGGMYNGAPNANAANGYAFADSGNWVGSESLNIGVQFESAPALVPLPAGFPLLLGALALLGAARRKYA